MSMRALFKSCQKLEQSISCKQFVKEVVELNKILEDKYKLLGSVKTPMYLERRKRDKTKTNYNFGQELIIDPLYNYKEMRTNLEILRKRVDVVEKFENNQTIHDEQAGFNVILNYVVLTLQKYTRLTDLAIEIITRKSINALIEVVTTEILTVKLESFEEQAQKESCFVPKLQGNERFDIINVLKASKIQAQTVGEDFIMNIKLPTFYTHKFKLFQVISLPFAYNNYSYVAAPTSQYYLISDNSIASKRFICPLSAEEKLRCHKIASRLVCYPHQPLQLTLRVDIKKRHLLPKIELCSDKTPKELLNATSACIVYQIPHKNKVITLTDDLFYLHIVEETNGTINCLDKTEYFTATESQMRTTERGCSLNLDNNILPERHSIYSKGMIKSNLSPITHITFSSEKTIHQPNSISINTEILLVIFICATIFLMTITWIILAYCNHRLNSVIFKISKNLSKQDNSKQVSDYPAVEFDCTFNFNAPSLPPKRGSKKHCKMTPTDYDIPKFNEIERIDENVQLLNDAINEKNKELVEYVTIEQINFNRE